MVGKNPFMSIEKREKSVFLEQFTDYPEENIIYY